MQHLTARQEQFCREYIIDLNATQAAMRSGYSKNTAKEIGFENLTKPHIQNRIEELKKDRLLRLSKQRRPNEQELETDADMVRKELKAIAFANPLDFFDIVDGALHLKDDALCGSGVGAIARISVAPANAKGIIHLSFQNKLRAIDLLMQHYGIKQTKTTSAPKREIIVNYIPDNNEDE